MINYWPPCLVIYTDDLPTGVGGEAGFLSVKIRLKYEHDVGLHQHEYTHEWQGIILFLIGAVTAALLLYFGYQQAAIFAVALGIAVLGIAAHAVLYKFARAYRQWAEVMAYRVQMRYPNSDNRNPNKLSLDDAAYRLTASRYDLELTLSEARELLRG